MDDIFLHELDARADGEVKECHKGQDDETENANSPFEPDFR